MLLGTNETLGMDMIKARSANELATIRVFKVSHLLPNMAFLTTVSILSVLLGI